MSALPPDEVIALLHARVGRLEQAIGSERAAVESTDVPRIFLVEAEYSIAMLQAELAWVRSLLDELVSGRIPGLADWRKWHFTGEISAELAELAVRGAAPE